MAQAENPNQEGKSLEGYTLRPSKFEELQKAVDLAFDYRGDVTLELKTGERFEGYVFDRNAGFSTPYLRLFLKGQEGTKVISYEEIVSIFFSGEDTAFGKSWVEWVKKTQKVQGK